MSQTQGQWVIASIYTGEIAPETARYASMGKDASTSTTAWPTPASARPACSYPRSCRSRHRLDTLTGSRHNGPGELSLRLIERLGAGVVGCALWRPGCCCKPVP